MEPEVSLAYASFLTRANQFYSITSYLFEIHFNIILAIEHKGSQIHDLLKISN
jgi:hypothetical protein